MVKILLADSDADALRRLRAELEGFGREVAAAELCYGASREALEKHPACIVVASTDKPEPDGLELLNEFGRKHAVILTGRHASFEYARRAMRLGAADYLIKPAAGAELAEALERAEKFLALLVRANAARPDGANTHTARFVTKNFLKYPTIKQVAEVLGLSPAEVSRAVREATGHKFNDWVNICRVERAKRLIKSGDTKLSQIGRMSGYADYAHFSERFRFVTGVSPSEFRDA